MIHSHDAGESRRRVVITGMGVIAANGSNLKTFWETIRDGKSAISLLSRFDTTHIPSKVAAEIKDFNPTLYMDTKSARRLDRSLQLSVAAARLATDDAGIDFSKVDADRTGVVEGSSLSNNECRSGQWRNCPGTWCKRPRDHLQHDKRIGQRCGGLRLEHDSVRRGRRNGRGRGGSSVDRICVGDHVPE
jgi:3-oxoacyl-(acyl-carrier-protein) synthase